MGVDKAEVVPAKWWRTHEHMGRVWIHDNLHVTDFHTVTDEVVHKAIDRYYEGGWAEFVPDYTPCVHGRLAIDCEHGNPRVSRCTITHEEA